jgi:RNA polymerase sigma-70 factor (ECF subfamily)
VEDAEDLVQDVFVELSMGKGNYDGHGNVPSYLLGIAKKIIYRYRKQKRRSVKNIPIVSIDKVGHSYETQQRLDPLRKISEREFKKAIEDTIAQLPPKAREAIRLRYINGLSLKESAEKAKCSVHTFCQRIVDAKKILRKHKKVLEDKL